MVQQFEKKNDRQMFGGDRQNGRVEQTGSVVCGFYALVKVIIAGFQSTILQKKHKI